MDYQGTIIEESLVDKSLIDDLVIVSTKVEAVGEGHQTPWLKQWTLHKVVIPESKADEVAAELSRNLDYSHKSSWYADYKNEHWHYIIFKEKIFKVNRKDRQGYQQASEYGLSLGIPEHQVNFSPHIK